MLSISAPIVCSDSSGRNFILYYNAVDRKFNRGKPNERAKNQKPPGDEKIPWRLCLGADSDPASFVPARFSLR
jgi:hypothetical protein